MAKYFAVMLQAGLTAPEAVPVLIQQSSGTLKKALSRVDARVQQGSSLGDALAMEKKVFSPIFIQSVVIGEQSATLKENLEQLATRLDKEMRLQKSIQSAMMYPSLVLFLAISLGFGIVKFVLPQITGLFHSLQLDLPASTRFLIWTSDMFEAHGILISIGFLIFAGLIYASTKIKSTRAIIDHIILHLPIFGKLLNEIQRARFCRTMGTLLHSGIAIEEGLSICSQVMTNTVYRNSVADMHARISTGTTLADIMEKDIKLYTHVIHRMVSVGEKSGSLGLVFTDLATFFEESVEVKSKTFSSLIEPLMLIVIGGVVAFVAISILTPIYSVTSGMNI